MGKYQHGPVHYRPKTWKAAKANRKKHEERIRKNRAVLRVCRAELEAAKS